MNTKNVPPLIMLTAGLIASVSMYIKHYELHTMLWILLAVLIIFYIMGLLIQGMFNVFGMQIEKAEAEAAAEENGQTDGVLRNVNEDGAVIEK